MSKYKGPRIRLIRRIGKITSLTTKNSPRKTRPGQRGEKRLSKARKETTRIRCTRPIPQQMLNPCFSFNIDSYSDKF